MANIVGLALRGLEFFWVLLILALTGNMIHEAFGGNPSIVNYVMFTAVFAMLSLFYLIPATLSEGFQLHGMLQVLVDGLNVLFTFVGGVAMAAYLGVGNCADNNYTKHNLVTAGSPDNMKRCSEAQASTAFLWFAFICFTASAVWSFMHRGSSMTSLRIGAPGIRRGPSMSQTSHA